MNADRTGISRHSSRRGGSARVHAVALAGGGFVVKPRSACGKVDQAWPRHVDHLEPLLFATPGQGPSRLDYRAGPSLAAAPQVRSTRAKEMKNSSGDARDRHALPDCRREPAPLARVLTSSMANHEIRARGKPFDTAMIFITPIKSGNHGNILSSRNIRCDFRDIFIGSSRLDIKTTPPRSF